MAKRKLTQNGTSFQWSSEKLLAAQLLAEDKLSDEAIAAECETSRSTLSRWKEAPEFQEKVIEIAAEIGKRLKRAGIRSRENRLEKLNGALGRIETIIKGRADDMPDVPGGKSGLLVRDYKGGEVLTPIYKFDAALVKEYRELMKQAAIEVGEWTEKKEHGGTIATVDLSLLSDAQLDKYEQFLLQGKPEPIAFALARKT